MNPYGTTEVSFSGDWIILEGSSVSVNYDSNAQALADTDGNFVDNVNSAATNNSQVVGFVDGAIFW